MNILKIFEKIELKKLEEQQENLALRLKENFKLFFAEQRACVKLADEFSRRLIQLSHRKGFFFF